MDASLVETFQVEGAVVVRGLFEPAWIELLRGAAVDILDTAFDGTERLGGAATSNCLSSEGMWRSNGPFARFLHQSSMADVAAAVLGSTSVRLYEDLFLYRDPGVSGADWHRDAPHWPVAGQQLCSVWFSLDPVAIDAGALHFVSGSHRDGADAVAGEAMVFALDSEREGRTVKGFATEPGDAIVFHPRILHTAFGAAPGHPRRTFTIRLAGDDVTWRPRSAYYHPWMRDAGLVRGEPLDHPWFPLLRPHDRGPTEPQAAVPTSGG